MKSLFLLISTLLVCASCKSLGKHPNGGFDVELDGIKINYTIKGKGPVMIVGHPNSGKIGYELTLKPLEDKFTMVYYSPRGTGKSDSPATIEGYSYNYIINEIELLRKHLKEDSIWIFGHSDQSEIALQYAIDYPKNVRGLILSGTHFIESAEIERKEKRDFENERKQQLWFSEVINDLDYKYKYQTNTDSSGKDLTYASLRWWCYDSISSDKVIPIYDSITKAGRRKPIDGQFPFTSKVEFEKLVNRTQLYQSKYSEIKTNVLILQGKFDTNNPPKLAAKLNSKIPNSTLIFIEKAGHFPWVEQPSESFDKILSWLKKIKSY